MPSKTSDLLNRLPSVSDLLDKPPIRALADRWNRSVVASGVRSFLDELRSDLQRRAADIQVPSVRELAERAARHVIALQQPTVRPAINATGRIQGPPWVSSPLAEASLERMFALGRDFATAAPQAQAGAPPAVLGDAVSLLCRLTQAQAATVAHSYAGAVWLTLAALADKQEVVVSRAEVGDIDSGHSLETLARSAGAILREVGSTNRTSAGDYESAIAPRTAAILRLTPDAYRIVGETEAPELDELVSLTRDRELAFIDALGTAPLTDLPTELGLDRRSVQAALAAGVDLVIVHGDGLIGGPPCGIILGNRELVARITNHPLCAAWQMDALRAAGLAAALENHTRTSQSESTLPGLRLLATPVDNLRDRAERIAPQLAQAPGVAAAEPMAVQSQLFVPGASERGLPSYGIALAATDNDINGLEKRLRDAVPQPILGRTEGDRVILDLRTVFPRQDQALVEGIAGMRRSESESQSTPAEAAP